MKATEVIKRRLLTIRDEWRLAKHQTEWRKCNSHNHTIAGRIFPINKVSVGNQTYGTLNVLSYDNEEEKLEIGSFCSIATNTYFILSGEHRFDTISSFPFRKVAFRGRSESICKGPIKVCDDVWIGYGCIVLSGVTIGQGAVIGAGSIVSKNVPPYSVFVNNHVIKYRFSDEIIEKLKNANYSRLKTLTDEQLTFLDMHISEDNIDYVLSQLFESTIGMEDENSEGA